MAQKQQYISHELLIHPGETLMEIIIERGISQKELAIRTGYSEKHISTVLNGKKSISSDFASKLEYALDIEASFWRNLQTDYDLELIKLNELHQITENEIILSKELEQVFIQYSNKGIEYSNETEKVLRLRKIYNISSLESINQLNLGFYRKQFVKNTSDIVMYAWQFLCEKEARNQAVNGIDIEKLKGKLYEIKQIMFEKPENHIEYLQSILNECGIIFIVRRHVKKAPISGLTVKTKNNKVMLAMTIRGGFIDLFWFTLFHEIAHIIYGDYLVEQNDTNVTTIEKRANEFAADILIDRNRYNNFLNENDFTDETINNFAQEVEVLPAIVYGRLMKDGKISWNKSNHRPIYEWSE